MLPVRDNSALREVLIQVGCHGSRVAVDSRHQMEYLVTAPQCLPSSGVTEGAASHCLIIRLIIQTIRAGGPAVPPDPRLRSWADAYRGRGRGEVNLNALPEPYLGALDHRPVGVFLALNPGRAVLGFQGRSGLFADEIRHHGTYSAWAATWPYLRDPWVATIGPTLTTAPA
jgi:hypothetical protein